MNCPQCGKSLKPGSRFCSQCGAQFNVPQGPGSAVKTGRGAWIAGIVLAVIAIALFTTMILLAPGSADEASAFGFGGFTLGQSSNAASEEIGSGGGTISIIEGLLEGFSINVPEGALDAPVDFKISAAPVESHDFGDDFNAASPLITVDNGGVYADKPMAVTIPVEKDNDEFAMAFFYDAQTGELQPMPLLSQSDDEIVTMTQHFSNIVVSRIKINQLGKTYDTGFMPATDGLQIPNPGSCISPSGYCAGKCIAAAYYYQTSVLNKGMPLFGRFDNDGVSKTPQFWYDDAAAVRLCSSIQTEVQPTLV